MNPLFGWCFPRSHRREGGGGKPGAVLSNVGSDFGGPKEAVHLCRCFSPELLISCPGVLRIVCRRIFALCPRSACAEYEPLLLFSPPACPQNSSTGDPRMDSHTNCTSRLAGLEAVVLAVFLGAVPARALHDHARLHPDPAAARRLCAGHSDTFRRPRYELVCGARDSIRLPDASKPDGLGGPHQSWGGKGLGSCVLGERLVRECGPQLRSGPRRPPRQVRQRNTSGRQLADRRTNESVRRLI